MSFLIPVTRSLARRTFSSLSSSSRSFVSRSLPSSPLRLVLSSTPLRFQSTASTTPLQSPETVTTPLPDAPTNDAVDWSVSFSGLSTTPFPTDVASILLEPVSPIDVEIKPDGIIYLPEIKYRRILNKAFGPGGWGLAPRGDMTDTGKSVSREYGLVVHGRLVSIARGEMTYFDSEGVATATEGAKSNALMRCCKDLGIASELWDPVFIRKFMKENAKEVWVEHIMTKKKRKIVVRKDCSPVYPYKETKA